MKTPWLRTEADLIGGDWLVYFKGHMGFEEVDLREYHSVISFKDDSRAHSVGGLPLHSRQWRIEDGVMKGCLYPPSPPSPQKS